MPNPTQVKFTNRDVERTFQNYPHTVSTKLLQLRQYVFEAAKELGIDDIEETLKWGEPSYISKNGSTLRITWKASRRNQYAMLFNCKTSLIETFKEVYSDTFEFEGNRAILFNEKDDVPIKAIKHCIELALTYHRVKHLPLLGV